MKIRKLLSVRVFQLSTFRRKISFSALKPINPNFPDQQGIFPEPGCQRCHEIPALFADKTIAGCIAALPQEIVHIFTVHKHAGAQRCRSGCKPAGHRHITHVSNFSGFKVQPVQLQRAFCHLLGEHFIKMVMPDTGLDSNISERAKRMIFKRKSLTSGGFYLLAFIPASCFLNSKDSSPISFMEIYPSIFCPVLSM